MKNLFRTYFALLIFFFSAEGIAQKTPPYWTEIQAFKKEDSTHQQPKNAIVFTGSSSFRLWKNVQEAFPNHTIVNRAFGGSTFPDVIRYVNDVVIRYKPKQVVVYCGDNDLASSDTVTAQSVARRFTQLFSLIRKSLPNASIVFVAIKPSPSRWHLKDKAMQANMLIKNFLKSKKKTGFVDIWNAMLDGDGKPNEELFIADKLHMNEKGYAIWQKKIEPYLLKN